MKSENHQDIIKEMADRLREHSVPYKEGAWERFNKAEPRKPRYLVLWPYLSAAAAILIAVILFLKPEENKIVESELAEQRIERVEDPSQVISKEVEEKGSESVQVEIGAQNEIAALASRVRAQNQLVKNNEVAFQSSDRILENPEVFKSTQVDEVKGKSSPVNTNTIISETPLASTETKEDTKANGAPNPDSFLESLLSLEKREGLIANQLTDNKWSVGINVSPNISSSRQLNMGGGVAIAYTVSPKVSLSSGISYLQLDAERMPGIPSQMASPSVDVPANYPGVSGLPTGAYIHSNSSVKTLNKTETNLVGLDIPITVNYHINKNFYASAGVSVFNVLSENRIHQFENQEINVFHSKAEDMSPEPVIRTFYSNEVASEKPYEGNNLNGFFNFSVGYSIPVSKKIGISIEPFLKIPMGSAGDTDMNLRNGGIKIGTRF